MNITMDNEVMEKLRTLLAAEDNNAAVVRVREARVGGGCESKLVLRLSIDERENEDIEAEISSIPFVINEEFAEQYGTKFVVTLSELQDFKVLPQD
jgi:iron-sulfur cluster insertion protein